MTTSTSGESLCSRISERLAQRVGPHRYGMWFDRSARLDYNDGESRLRVAVPNRFVADWIEKHFSDEIRGAALQEVGRDVELSVSVESGSFTPSVPGTSSNGSSSVEQEEKISSGANAPVRAEPGIVGTVGHKRRPTTLRYRMKDFIVGSGNELAYSASNRLVDDDDSAANPLFIHGGVGLGKTHLLQGICRKMLSHRPEARVLYATGEQFTNEFLTAVRGNQIDAFRRKIRRLDLLAVDDIHFIADKEKTQQEFLHSFNAVELSGARVVLASDCHPKMIERFSEALVSRCVRGMVVEVRPPDTATRMKIIQALAQRRGISLLESVAAAVANRCTGSVRDIEGTLTRLEAIATLLGDTAACNDSTRNNHAGAQKVIGHTVVNKLFSEQDGACGAAVCFDNILQAISTQLRVNREQITASDRRRMPVQARSLAVYLAREMTQMSYPEIAAALGRQGHSAVVAADQKVRKQVSNGEVVLIPNGALGSNETMKVSELIDQLKAVVIKSTRCRAE